MTERYNALVVSLDRDIRQDDAEHIINAIAMLKGVNGVTPNSVDPDTFSNQLRITKTVTDSLYEVIAKLNKM